MQELKKGQLVRILEGKHKDQVGIVAFIHHSDFSLQINDNPDQAILIPLNTNFEQITPNTTWLPKCTGADLLRALGELS